MIIRYIDFGLSELLTPEFCEDINNIELKGTPYYLPPELFICAFMLKYIDRSENHQKNKIMYYITKHVEKALEVIGEKQIIAEQLELLNPANKILEKLVNQLISTIENNQE